jgi:outer membrane protein assembly factor BamB
MVSWRKRSRLVAVFALVAISSCGKHAPKPAKRDGGAVEAWAPILPLSDQLPGVAIVKSDREFALVDPAGTLLGRRAISDENFLRNTLRRANTLVMVSKDSLLAIDVTTGKERWKAKLAEVPTLFSIGSKTVGVAHESGIALYDLASGEVRYKGTPRPDRMYADKDDFLFVQGADIWIVDEASGQERWRKQVDGNSQVMFDAAEVVVRGDDGHYTQIDRTNGRVLGTGSRAKAPSGGELQVALLETATGHDYQLLRVRGKLAVVARDAVGHTMWTAPWPRAEIGGVERAIEDATGAHVAFVDSTGTRTLNVFDVKNGHLTAAKPLAPNDRFVGIAGPCAVLLVRSPAGRLVCVDTSTGQETWTIPTAGTDAAAWLLAGGDVLLADSNPITASRIGPSGNRAWQVELPNTMLHGLNDRPELEKPVRVDTSNGASEWYWSPGIAIGTTASGFRVLDMASGKMREVKP